MTGCTCWIGRGEPGGSDRHKCPIHCEPFQSAHGSTTATEPEYEHPAAANYLWVLEHQILPNQYGLKRVALLKAIDVLKSASHGSSPEATAQHPADMDLPDEVIRNGVNLRVIRQAYDWDIDIYGELHGLTAGDHGFEPTGIKIKQAAPEATAEGWQPTTALELLNHIQRGHLPLTDHGYIECSCGATFWLPSPPQIAPMDQEPR